MNDVHVGGGRRVGECPQVGEGLGGVSVLSEPLDQAHELGLERLGRHRHSAWSGPLGRHPTELSGWGLFSRLGPGTMVPSTMDPSDAVTSCYSGK